MGWWSSIVDGAKYAQEGVINSAKWIWGWTYTPLVKTGTYTANTFVHFLEQLIALRHAIPALASDESRKTLQAIGQITLYKIIPLIMINSLNTMAQNVVRNGRDEMDHAAWYNDAIGHLFTAVDWAVWAYVSRQSAELFVQTMIIDSAAPSAFSAYKAKLPPPTSSPCIDANCNFKRRTKDLARAPAMLLFNELLTLGIGYIPYVGGPTAKILEVYFTGDVIVRSALLHLCERHRTTHSELLLVFGLKHKAWTMIMDKLFEATIGMPPFLVQRTLHHLLLLWEINTAAHMKIDYVAQGKGTLPIDPVIAFESASRIVTDTLLAGTQNQVAKLLRPDPNTPPYFSLSSILKKLTEALNSDLEKEHTQKPGFFTTKAKKALPPIFRSTQNAINDPVIRIFWPNIQGLLLDILDIVKDAGMPVNKLTKTSIPFIAPAVKKAIPEILYRKYGVSKKVTSFLITLCKDDEFWGFVLALKQWVERHNIADKSELAQISFSQLAAIHEDSNPLIIEPPKEHEQALLMPQHSKTQVVLVDPSLVVSKSNSTQSELSPSFWLARKRNQPKDLLPSTTNSEQFLL